MTKKINQYFTFDDSKKECSLPTISKKTKYTYNSLKDFTLYASGSPSDTVKVKERLKSKKNYLNYLSFLSLWIEINFEEEKSQKIVFYNTPYTASEKERKNFVELAIDIIDKLNEIKSNSNSN